MSKIVAQPINAKEPDLLIGNENKPLKIQDLSGKVLNSITPDGRGWTHAQLLAINIDSMAPEGWDAYLGDEWIGSSEI
ncbi:hypothetical protein [Serratia plymuthica]|uniref:Uncharacterized protein n=1 Tax=Serratia plymuthica TaxID=82996 RepID=A0A318NS11_SERPL|nr:hypothetical protein [Serratia plymuthica]PYD36569.1 hypothetical protein CT690_23785 [Serratia plymuthica]